MNSPADSSAFTLQFMESAVLLMFCVDVTVSVSTVKVSFEGRFFIAALVLITGSGQDSPLVSIDFIFFLLFTQTFRAL